MSVRHRFVTLLIASAWATACGSGGSSTAGSVPRPAGPVPAGVDSTTAARADSLADVSFVAEQQEEQATRLQDQGRILVQRTDSMWTVMAALLDSGRVVSPDDSLAAGAATTRGGEALVQLDGLLRSEDIDVDALSAQTALLLDSAEVALEQAFALNPFDTRSQVWLAQVYGLQARRLGQVEAYDRAIATLEKLALLTPDQHTVHAMLANNYFYVEDWNAAAASYERAEDVYRRTWDLAVDAEPAFDSTVAFAYVQAQGDMHLQRMDAAAAADAFRRALSFALTAEDSAYVAGEMEWMAWDDMNIRSAFARDSLLALEQSGDLNGARRGYGDLLRTLSARGAIDETEWRLAIVDYNLGNNEDAAARLQSLVARTPTDATGAPIDPSYARYFDDYGTLCLNLGRLHRVENRDRRTALKYFTQATTVAWSGRAVAHYEVARLTQGNVPSALESATSALDGVENLSEAQQLDLYRILMELTRRTGDFDKAAEYRDAYRALRGGQAP